MRIEGSTIKQCKGSLLEKGDAGPARAVAWCRGVSLSVKSCDSSAA